MHTCLWHINRNKDTIFSTFIDSHFSFLCNFGNPPPAIVENKVSLLQKQEQRHLTPLQDHTPRCQIIHPADGSCTPQADAAGSHVPSTLFPLCFSRFYIHLFRTGCIRNISCNSILQDTISSAIILFVAKQATLYAGCKRLRIQHLQRIRPRHIHLPIITSIIYNRPVKGEQTWPSVTSGETRGRS